MTGAQEIPDLAPILCEGCGDIAILQDRAARPATDNERDAVKSSPAWLILGPVQRMIFKHNAERN